MAVFRVNGPIRGETMRLLISVLTAALAAGAVPAIAQEAAPPPAAVAPGLLGPDQLGGTWTLDGLTEGSASCSFQLGVNETIGGWTLNFPPSCRRAFPVETIIAWRVNPETGSIVFSNAERHTVFEFERTADGAYVANPEGVPGMVIGQGDPAEQRPPTPQEAMTGTWRISALGVAGLCSFDLTSDARGRSGSVAMRPGCTAEWRDRGWARWRMDGKQISLLDGRGREIIDFKRVDLFTFERRPPDNPYVQRGEIMFFGKVM